MAEIKRPARRPAKSFDQYVAEKTAAPAGRAYFDASREKVRTIADLFEALDARRIAQRLSKAEVGRRAGVHPTAISRLFGDDDANPTVSTLIELLTALDLHGDLTFRPRSKTDHVLDVKLEYAAAS